MVKAPLTKRQTVSTVYVLKGKATNLLSCNTAERLGLVQFACKVEPMDKIYTKSTKMVLKESGR